MIIWPASGEDSSPTAIGARPIDTAAVEPAEEPPGDLLVSEGNSVWPPRDE